MSAAQNFDGQRCVACSNSRKKSYDAQTRRQRLQLANADYAYGLLLQAAHRDGHIYPDVPCRPRLTSRYRNDDTTKAIEGAIGRVCRGLGMNRSIGKLARLYIGLRRSIEAADAPMVGHRFASASLNELMPTQRVKKGTRAQKKAQRAYNQRKARESVLRLFARAGLLDKGRNWFSLRPAASVEFGRERQKLLPSDSPILPANLHILPSKAPAKPHVVLDHRAPKMAAKIRDGWQSQPRAGGRWVQTAASWRSAACPAAHPVAECVTMADFKDSVGSPPSAPTSQKKEENLLKSGSSPPAATQQCAETPTEGASGDEGLLTDATRQAAQFLPDAMRQRFLAASIQHAKNRIAAGLTPHDTTPEPEQLEPIERRKKAAKAPVDDFADIPQAPKKPDIPVFLADRLPADVTWLRFSFGTSRELSRIAFRPEARMGFSRQTWRAAVARMLKQPRDAVHAPARFVSESAAALHRKDGRDARESRWYAVQEGWPLALAEFAGVVSRMPGWQPANWGLEHVTMEGKQND